MTSLLENRLHTRASFQENCLNSSVKAQQKGHLKAPFSILDMQAL